MSLVLIAGCAVGVSRTRYSKPQAEGPTIPTRNETYVGEMYDAGDVAFHIFPLNATSTDFMIFPFPHKFREPTEHESPFLIGVGLKSQRDGYTFNPATAAYWTNPSARSTPKRIQGPYACGSQHARPPMVAVESVAIPLAANACQYLWLEFDGITPDPSQRFFVQLTLTVDQHEVQLPIIEFLEAKRTETVAIP